MELGSWAIIKAPSLLALIPLLIYIVLVMINKPSMNSLLISVVVGCLLCGLNLAGVGKLFTTALSSSLVAIGFLTMMGAGLGEVLNRCGVAKTIVYYIVKKIGINSEKKGILVTMVASLVIVTFLGTMNGGNAVIAPIIIPLVAAVGLTPSAVAVLFKVCGDVGLVWGPLSSATVMLLSVTGLSYGAMMLWAGIPFGLAYMAGALIGVLIIQKRYRGKETYDISADVTNHLDTIEIKPEEKRATIAFIVSFLALIIYSFIAKLGTNGAYVVIILCTFITGFVYKMKLTDIINAFIKGCSTMTFTIFLFILFNMMLDLIKLGGGWTALSDLMSATVAKTGKVGVTLISALIGCFGIEAAAPSEIQLLYDMFWPVAMEVGLPIQIFIISLLAGTRLTASFYPSANLVASMAIAKTPNTKNVLIGTWCAVGAALIFIVIWAIFGPLLVSLFY